MKVVYFGYDPLSTCLEVFLQQGHELVVIYTGENNQFSDKVIQLASKHNLELCFDKPTLSAMQLLVDSGVEMFFSAEFPWKIPLPADLKYAINVHPTLLPEGRGMTPLPQLILKQSIYAGITLHKLNNEFDTGDILLQQSILLDEEESFDSLSSKVLQQTPDLLLRLLSDLDNYYLNSQTQGEGSYWPTITRQQQTLDWQQPSDVLLATLRAFGSLGTYADISGKTCVITSASAKRYKHNYSAGQIILDTNQHLLIATIDGELCIPKESLLC